VLVDDTNGFLGSFGSVGQALVGVGGDLHAGFGGVGGDDGGGVVCVRNVVFGANRGESWRRD